MKKHFITGCIFILATTFGASAQELKSAKGENYLPEEKDFGLSIDANPFLGYLGGLMSNNGATPPTAQSLANAPFTITGKYFTKPDFAYRARLRIGVMNQTFRNTVINNANTSVDTAYTNDSKKVRGTEVNLGFGFEKRRGKTRLQGYYGAEGNIHFSSSSTEYSYGNSFTNTNTSIFTTDFETPSATGFSSGLSNNRIGAVKNGNTLGIGLRGFAGVEYFILPKMSLGAELGWGLTFRVTNDGFIRTEYWDNVSSNTRQRQLNKAGGNYFGIDTDNSGGRLMLHFYF